MSDFTLTALEAQAAQAAASASPAPTTEPAPPVPAVPSADAPPPAPAAPTVPAPSPVEPQRGSQYADLDGWGKEEPPAPRGPETEQGWQARQVALLERLDANLQALGQNRADPAEVRQLRDQLAVMQAALDGLRNGNASPLPTQEEQAPSDEELMFALGDEGAAYVKSLAAKVKQLEGQVTTRVAPLEQQVTLLDSDQFRGRLRERLGPASAVFQEPGWASFVQQPAPFSGGRTFNQILHEADAARDADRIQEVVSAYQAARGAQNGASVNPVDAAFAQLAVPERVSAGAPISGQRFRVGDLGQMVDRFQRGEVSFDALQRFDRAFRQAEQQNRVDP